MNKFNTTLSMTLLCGMICGCTENGFFFHSNSDYDDVSEKVVYYIGEPYRIKGVLYTPAENMSYSEKGMASWYSRDTQNRLTTNGEIFDDSQMTAAHKTLPLPSIVRITNLTNGNTAIVRVNDRGPAVNNRLIDVSRSVAEALEMSEVGTTPVQVDILPDESRRLKKSLEEYVTSAEDEMVAVEIPTGEAIPIYQPDTEVSLPVYDENPPLPNKKEAVTVMALPPVIDATTKIPQNNKALSSKTNKEKNTPQEVENNSSQEGKAFLSGQFRIQAGVFGQKANAERAIQKLGKISSVSIKQNGNLTTVYAGPFNTRAEAQSALAKIKQIGYGDAWIQTIK